MSTPRRRRGRFGLGRRSPFLPPAPADERTTVVDERSERPVPPPEEPGRGLWPWLLALLLLVAAGLALAWWLTQEDDDEDDAQRTVVFIQVPSLVDLERGEAVRLVTRAGLRVTVREVPSQEERGTVVAQEPPAGERVRRGTTVSINVSEGPPPVAVPELVGLTEAQAASRLTALGLEANVVRVQSTAPDGEVVAQNPAQGERLPVGSRVRLNVSSGVTQTTTTGTTATTAPTTTTPTTATTTVARSVSVPDVVGVQEAEAAATLQSAGLFADSYPVSSAEPGGVVVGQNPPGGETAAQASTIRLNVSVGRGTRPLGAVPDVTGLNQRAARRLLRRAGYTVRAIYRAAREPEDVGEVLLQAPAAGRDLRVYAQVTIYVGRAA